MQKPSNAKGTRDFGPEVVKKRNYILSTIKGVFERYGFEPLQTPALENLSTLTGKYGDEGDKLLFKVLNSGNIAASIKQEDVETENNAALISSLSEKGLRYDLTVPFARFVVQHRNDITFPFKRYQIQEVWRADKPQKGRYREFTQCDADVIGSNSMVNEADLVLIYNDVFNALGLSDAVLKINHRKFLEAMVEQFELNVPLTTFTVILDKLDKIGREGVQKELVKVGIAESTTAKLLDVLDELNLDQSSFDKLRSVFPNNSNAERALNELEEIRGLIEGKGTNIKIELDLSLARGLDYYTGCIFEAIVPNSGIGSVSGGGRYDDLTGVFGWKDVSGVGISFGIDRIYDILETRALFDLAASDEPDVLFCHFDEKARSFAFDCTHTLRAQGIKSQVYPDVKKLKKQLDYANKTNKTHVVVIGDNEMESGQMALKDMRSGESNNYSIQQIAEFLGHED